jgi:quinol monooxygenase YgiN
MTIRRFRGGAVGRLKATHPERNVTMAFVRIGQFQAVPEKTTALREIYETEAIPAIRAAAGNVSAVLLQEHQAPDCFMAITVWQSKEDAEAYDRSGQAAGMVDKIRFAFAGPPTLKTYDAFGVPARQSAIV